MIENILRYSLYHPLKVILFTSLVACYGIFSFFKLPIDAVPDITNNQVQINTILGGLSPIQIEKQVSYVIETALAGIPGLQMTRSLSRNGFSQVTAIFDDNVDIYFARQQINERLNEAIKNLPEGAEIHMGPLSTGLGEIYMWTVDFIPHSEKNENRKLAGWMVDGSYRTQEGQILKNEEEKASYLCTIQDWIIKPQLKSIPGLAEIDSIGGYVLQYHIEPNIEKMIALGLSFDNLIQAVQKNNLSISPGYIEKLGEGLLVKSDERLNNPKEIETIVVATREGIPIRIRDIAEVKIGKEMRTGSATHNGKESVIGTALMLIGSNSRTVSQAVEQKLSEITHTLPPDITITPVLNRTKLVNATIDTVAKNLSEGAILVIAILFAFLGHFRASLITALVIPLSMLMTAIGMVHTQISGNLMSLGAIDFGLIIDGAVIITENCLRRLSLTRKALRRDLTKQERIEEVLAASQEMIQPTVIGQAIIITVYVPILTLSGVEGKMFYPMAMTVIMALISAFILSLTFVPTMISLFVKGNMQENEKGFVHFIKKIYQSVLEKVLRFPLATTLSSLIVVLISLILFFRLGEEFIPTLDERDLAMHVMRIPSTSLSQSTEMQKDVEKTLLTLPEVSFVFSKTGTAEMASDPMPPNVSDTFIILKKREEWPNPELTKEDLIHKIEQSVQFVPGNNYEFTQPIEMRFNELISGVRSDLAVKVYGDNFSLLEKTAESISQVLKGIPGAADVKVSQMSGLPVLDIKIDRETTSRLGLNVSDILEVISIALGGGKAGQLFEGDRRFDIIVKLPDSSREDLTTISQLPIPLKIESKKAYFSNIPLGEVASLNIQNNLNEVRRENGKRFITIQANVRGSDLGTFVEQAKQEIRDKVKIPSSYWLDWGGQFENLLSARNRLFIVIPIALMLIFIFLYSAFNSARYALLVFTSIPLALTGGILSLWIRNMPFSISAAVGFIALSGIAVLNGLVLVTSINQLRDAESHIEKAIKKGALQRIRPVLMTALVASFGFIPMALASGTGAEVQKPLATVVIGGIISATILTLLVLPALYKLFAAKQRYRDINYVE
ncbi:efflux RND transporter permease subunit [Candidatus Protochlamydia sp. W-9]|uniref:efflux RND transporter permease subunit n=1 Tax=Candidatus Protochlamydia sp. W-9 TaxID=1785087 RepID=UPI00096AA2E8|nr:CusA/CzcA family heavy metal efflux RND transporter [Candidatus Protochlamydia sp. W-9]